jgi:hypothetical protein
MMIRLKIDNVKCTDDRGVSLHFNDGTEQSSHVVLSILEVFPRLLTIINEEENEQTGETAEDVTSHRASKILPVMLGQICRDEFYRTLDNDYQESFVLQP